MKLQLKTVLKTLDNKPLKNAEDKDITLGEVLAEIMLSSETGGKMKTYSLAQDFYKGSEKEIDAADLALIKNITETSKAYRGSGLILGQVLVILEGVK